MRIPLCPRDGGVRSGLLERSVILHSLPWADLRQACVGDVGHMLIAFSGNSSHGWTSALFPFHSLRPMVSVFLTVNYLQNVILWPAAGQIGLSWCCSASGNTPIPCTAQPAVPPNCESALKGSGCFGSAWASRCPACSQGTRSRGGGGLSCVSASRHTLAVTMVVTVVLSCHQRNRRNVLLHSSVSVL